MSHECFKNKKEKATLINISLMSSKLMFVLKLLLYQNFVIIKFKTHINFGVK